MTFIYNNNQNKFKYSKIELKKINIFNKNNYMKK